MSEWASKVRDIIDCHVHMGPIAGEQALLDICEATGIERMCLVAIQDPAAGAGLPQALYMKARHPGRFFVFAGLNHAGKLFNGNIAAPSLVEQVDAFAEMGCDGIKMIEGKPTSRQRMDIPVTDAYFADYWARAEALGVPMVWHVNDPEEFWDPDKTPAWAKQRNWGYGPDDVQKEALYTEVDDVLARHPGLKVVFAHFYFLSADLPRAARFFEEHPSVLFDLAPGIEMLHNISRDPATRSTCARPLQRSGARRAVELNDSRDPEAGREFFLRWADRIVFGTDLASGLSVPEGRARAGIVFRWLESDDTFRVPPEADFLLGDPADGVIRGMALPDDVLAKIYRGNFTRLVGAEPKTLNVDAAAAECRRLAEIAQALSGKPAEGTEAARAAEALVTGS